MKNLLTGLFVLALSFCHAQMKQGVVTYTMSYSSDDPDTQMALAMMENSTMTTYFMPHLSKVVLSMGVMMDMETIVDSKKDKALMLMSMMGVNYAIEGKASEFKDENAEEVTKTVTLMDESKSVMGYVCKKALVNTSNGTLSEVWYTDDIKAEIEGQQYYDSGIPGFAMEINTTVNGMNISFVVTEISDEVEKSDFKMTIPDGYEKKSLDDLKTMGQ